MTNTEVAIAADISRTAARRYLMTLCHYGYAQTDGRHFWLRPRVMRLSHGYLEAVRLPRLVQPFLQRLAMTAGEPVNISVLDGHEVAYIAHSTGPRLLSVFFQAGARAPAHVVSAGYVALAQEPPEVLNEWISQHTFSSFTPHTITQPEVFRERVEQARQFGYAHTEQQLDIGMHGLGVPLQDRRGQFVGVLSTTMSLRSCSTREALERMLPLLLDTQQALCAVL